MPSFETGLQSLPKKGRASSPFYGRTANFQTVGQFFIDLILRSLSGNPLQKELCGTPSHHPGVLGNGRDPGRDQIRPAPIIEATHAKGRADLDPCGLNSLKQVEHGHAVDGKGRQTLPGIFAAKGVQTTDAVVLVLQSELVEPLSAVVPEVIAQRIVLALIAEQTGRHMSVSLGKKGHLVISQAF